MKMLLGSLALAVMAGCNSVPTVSATSSSGLKGLARAYVQAEFSFDQQAIRDLTAPAFVEISPRGEVDERDKVISFYARDKRTAAPAYTISNAVVRTTNDTAVITQTITIGKSPRTMSLSQGLTAAYTNGQWKLTSSQTTPIPPPSPGK